MYNFSHKLLKTNSYLFAAGIAIAFLTIILGVVFPESIFAINEMPSNILIGIGCLLCFGSTGGGFMLGIILLLSFVACIFSPPDISSSQDLILDIFIFLFALTLTIVPIIRFYNVYKIREMRLQRLKDYIINTDFCPKCSNSDIHKSAYKKKISPLFEALYKLTNQSGESFSRTREKIIKRVETFNLCNACSVNLAESINKYLDEFLTFDFENISFKSKQHEEQKELKECPFCSELIDKNLDECPFCAEKLE